MNFFLRVGLVLAACQMTLWQPSASAQNARPPSPSRAPTVRALTPDATIARTLSRGQSHVYGVMLEAGQFIHIGVEHQGIDVASTIVGPDGRGLVSVDDADDFGVETIVAIGDVTGRHTVRIRPASSGGSTGRYSIRIEELRASVPMDLVRIEAEREYQRGRALRRTDRGSDWPLALAAFDAALDRYRRVSDRRGAMKTLLQISRTRYTLLDPAALGSAQQAEQIARTLDDGPARAEALFLVGLALDRTGDLPAALRAHEESTAISRAIGDRRREAESLNGAGIVLGRRGEAERAVAVFERALTLARGTNLPLVSMLNNMGIAYRDLGDYEKALKMYEQGLALMRSAKRLEGEILILNNMGNLHRLLGNPRRALELHTQALALSRQSGGKENHARSLNTVGQTHSALGEYEKALEYHRESLDLRRQLGDLPGQAASLESAGRAWHRLGDSERALAALRDALAIRRNIHEQYGESSTLHAIAAVQRDRGNLAEALTEIAAAVDLDETLRMRITSPQLRASFAAAEQDKYELFIDVLQRRHRLDPAGGDAAAALHVSERSRARVLLDSLLEGRVELEEGSDATLLARERTLQKQLNDASARLSRAFARQTAEDERKAAAGQLERLVGEYQEVQRQIRQQSPRYASLTQPQPLTATEIQQDVLDDDTVLLEFALGEDRSWLWAVTRQAVMSVDLPSRKTLETAARSLYAALTARQPRRGEPAGSYAARVAAADRQVRRDAESVSQMLFDGIAAQLNGPWRGKRLVIVAAGALEYLPFGALPVPRADDDGVSAGQPAVPLLARHEIVEAPSASVLATLRRETTGREPAGRAVAILADPVFDAGDPRVTNPSRRAPRAMAASPATEAGDATAGMWPLSRAIERTDLMRGRLSLPRLPFSRDEASSIAALAGRDRTLSAIDFEARRATALGRALEDYRIVHFATHGIIDGERPELSGLILSLVSEKGMPQDGFLRLHDIFNMRLNADLVVLSACQTALGKEVKGEGLVGLTRGFMYAGAPRVVASLWQVSDAATAELMKKFYAGMLQRRLTAAAALRAAQLEMAEDRRWRSPYFWAGFVLQGDWR